MAAPPPKPPVTTIRTPIRTPIVPRPITTPPKPTLLPTRVPPVVTTIPTTISTISTTTTVPPSRIIVFTSNTPVSRPPKTTTTSLAVTGDSGGMSPGAVAGMAAGVLAVLIGSVVGAFLLLKQRNKRILFKGSSRKYKGYPEPDLSRLPVQRYKPDDNEATAPGHNDDSALYRNSTLGSNGKRRIDVTSSYYDDEFNKANQPGYSESWTGFVANGRRQGSESGQQTPNSTGPLVASATSLPLGSMSTQEELHGKGNHELGYTSDDHLEPQNLAHVMPMNPMPRAPSMRSSGYGYDHVPPMGPMGSFQHRSSGYYPSPQLRPHPGRPYPGPHPHDFQGFQRPVSAFLPGPGSAPGPYMRPPPPFGHPYNARQPYGRTPPGGGPRPYSAFSTSGNLQMLPVPHPQYSASDLNTPNSPVSPVSPFSPVSPTSTLVSPVSPTSTLLSNPQLYTSDDQSKASEVTGGDLSRTSGANSTASDSQTCVASPVFLPGDSSRPLVVPDVDDKAEAGKNVEEAVLVSFSETEEYYDDGKEEVLLEPVDDVDNENVVFASSPTAPPPLVNSTKPTSISA
ncbi:hypothetical protein BGZ74_010785 [Mortierella antarctica]|nr:hypothetical protein BGZ74_010785 [Mortierella antarctica]